MNNLALTLLTVFAFNFNTATPDESWRVVRTKAQLEWMSAHCANVLSSATGKSVALDETPLTGSSSGRCVGHSGDTYYAVKLRFYPSRVKLESLWSKQAAGEWSCDKPLDGKCSKAL